MIEYCCPWCGEKLVEKTTKLWTRLWCDECEVSIEDDDKERCGG